MPIPKLIRWARAALRLCASLQLAVVLIVLLAVVLAVATVVEADKGRDYARWYFYTQDWFLALLGLLGLNILAATLVRFPWKARQFGFVVTHAGLLVLLVGSIITFIAGVEGVVSLEEGETCDRLTIRDTSRFTVQWQSKPSEEPRPVSAFMFQPGPVDWPEGKTLRLGAINGIDLRVTRFLTHARPAEVWSPAEDGAGIPALRFSLVGPDNSDSSEQWLTATRFGGSAAAGSAKVEFQLAEADTMLEDFLNPPAKEGLDPQGVLSIHHDGRMQRVAVGPNVGKKIVLGGDVSVEIAAYLPHAKLQADGKFVNVDQKPVHPVLELKVHLPNEKEPVPQTVQPSFANPGGMRAARCPVKFWYHHPDVAAEPAVEFLATSGGRLHCRVGNKKYEARGEVHEGDTLEAWSGTTVSVVRFVPHARRELVFTPVKPSKREQFEAAAQVELTIGDFTQRIWLQRGEQGGMPIPLKTPEGMLGISYGYETRPLGFSLALKKFTRGLNPGGMGDASFASTVRLLDEAREIDREQEISMNDPLMHDKYMFYQSGVLPSGTGTVLTVASDPGLLWKYVGSIMTCVGTLIMFVTRSKWATILPFTSSRTTTLGKEQLMRKAIAASVALIGFAGSAMGAAQDERYDWQAWRSLAVQDCGRQKPLDSLAWETWRLLGNRVSFKDPETKESLEVTGFYVASMLDSPSWDKRPAKTAPPIMQGGTCSGSAAPEPDKWDAMQLLTVDSLELRKLLDMTPDQKCIAPADLRHARLQLPDARKPTNFMLWTQQLVFKPEGELSPLEKKGLELFQRLRAYEDHRAGRRLEILPIPGMEDKQWISLDSLMRTPLDDKTDPDGKARELRQAFLDVRAAWQGRDPAKFNAASRTFVALARDIGSQLGDYPSSRLINMEVAYNHWAPFRFSWVLTTIACICILLHMGSGWKALYPLGLLAYAAGMAAMIAGFVMRVVISGRAPVTNMYESVIYVGLGVAAIGLVLEWIYRKRFIAVAAAAVSTVALILADNSPGVLDSSLQPLQPVLRNNFWLVTHVMTITLSYAAFALAMGIANITLGYFLVRSRNAAAIEALSRFTYRALQVGVVLLAAGTFLGGMWAAYSWGRFWGWDPKEVWALIALLGYLAVLHARFAGWVRQRGLAALSVSCFALVVIAWYGVNFVLGAGLHSYGFGGGGGKVFMGGLIGAQALFTAVALWRSRKQSADGKPRLRLADPSADDREALPAGSSEAA